MNVSDAGEQNKPSQAEGEDPSDDQQQTQPIDDKPSQAEG
jgi:hypothetical protein